jgi:hypothetical protein
LIRDNKTSDFLEDGQGTLWLGKRIFVPNLEHIKELIPKEAHDSTYSIQSCKYQDVQVFENPILVVRNEVRCRRICGPM